MKTTLSRKTAYLGAGAGMVLFALFGLLPGLAILVDQIAWQQVDLSTPAPGQ